jgi:hypothetical protein
MKATKTTKKTAGLKQLICAVRLINTPAAKFLNGNELTKLASFRRPEAILKPAAQLFDLFAWSESKQGYSFWSSVWWQLLEVEPEAMEEFN